MTPLVTAVVATYKAGDYLRQAVASALAQTFLDLEVLVCDDAADPAVRDLAEAFGDPRVRYRANPERLGPARNHWAGFAAARGRYLAVLNHDDLWRPEFLATLVPPLERDPSLAVAFCDHDVIDADGRPVAGAADATARQWGRDRLAPGPHRPFRRLAVGQTLPLAMGAMFRRDAVDPAALPDVGPAYDLWLTYALSRAGAGAWYTPRRLTGWRVHPTQLTATGGRGWSEGAVACWRAMIADPGFAEFRPEIRAKLSASEAWVARVALAQDERAAARRFARAALATRPTNWRAAALLALACLPPAVGRRVFGARSAARPDPATGAP